MKLYHAKGSCSLGIRILLEEIGLEYELIELKLALNEHRQEPFVSQNPKGKVPALIRPDGQILTEFPVIAQWLAEHHPQAQLLGETPSERWRVLEMMEYIVSSLHMRGATLVFRADRFAPNEEAQAFIKDHGLSVVKEGLAQLEQLLAGRDSFFSRFTLADAALYYLLDWQGRLAIDLPQGLAAYYEALSQRPSVKRAKS